MVTTDIKEIKAMGLIIVLTGFQRGIQFQGMNIRFLSLKMG